MAIGAVFTIGLLVFGASTATCGGCSGKGGAVVALPDTAPRDDAPEPTCTSTTPGGGCADGWCRIPAGIFTMGSPANELGRGRDDEDQVVVTLTHSFEIQQFTTTQAEWVAAGFVNASGVGPDGGDCLGPLCPASQMSWYEAVAYANKRSRTAGKPECYTLTDCTGGGLDTSMVCASVTLTATTVYDCKGYRLPTEAEWEYAARAGTTTTWYSGDMIATDSRCIDDPALTAIAWYCKTAPDLRTHRVGLLRPNPWCLYDMIGNVWQWTWDWFDDFGYGKGPLTDPQGQHGQPDTRVMRGCIFNSWSFGCRTANRFANRPEQRSYALGFRLVRTL